MNLFVHLENTYLLYKISGKKIYGILYGLNPFVLIEGIANVHNDIFMVLFILLALFELLKRKKLLPSLIFLALATDIKYFAILLLPIIVIYYFRNEDLKTRIIKCIKYGFIYIALVFIPYIIFTKDINVFIGLIEQRKRLAKGMYLFLRLISNNSINTDLLKNIALILFTIAYFITNIKLITNKKISFRKEIRKIFIYMLAFLFLLITNFQPWYFISISAFIIWQKAKNIKLIVQMQILLLFSNIVFLINSENYKYGPQFFLSFVIGILICIIINSKFMKNLLHNTKKELMEKNRKEN